MTCQNALPNKPPLGPGHPYTLLSRGNLAYTHHKAGNGELSAEMFARTLADSERHLGPDHPATRHARQLLTHVRSA
ncbi:tetratricopeptide repeat protein [Streptomyces phaeochromogenes]|uniref:tetratricopeptide repeat protein n=1 Tax=Streptomyces phaeochromogenes TaxID=1923 RepID=UPI0037113839